MDRFVVRGGSAQPSSRAVSKPRQRKLEHLKKVVTLDAGTSALCFKEEDLQRYQGLLQEPGTAPEVLLLTLRKLSVHEIGAADLEAAPLLQPSVQMLEYHTDAQVARLAGRLVDKWMQILRAADAAAGNADGQWPASNSGRGHSGGAQVAARGSGAGGGGWAAPSRQSGSGDCGAARGGSTRGDGWAAASRQSRGGSGGSRPGSVSLWAPNSGGSSGWSGGARAPAPAAVPPAANRTDPGRYQAGPVAQQQGRQQLQLPQHQLQQQAAPGGQWGRLPLQQQQRRQQQRQQQQQHQPLPGPIASAAQPQQQRQQWQRWQQQFEHDEHCGAFRRT